MRKTDMLSVIVFSTLCGILGGAIYQRIAQERRAPDAAAPEVRFVGPHETMVRFPTTVGGVPATCVLYANTLRKTHTLAC